MKYFVRIKRDGKIIKPLFGHFTKLYDADTIARHESRESQTDRVDVVDEKGSIKRSYGGGEIFKSNPAKRKLTTKINRKSQITKIKPTKRLAVRRKKNTVKGYFPNPTENKYYLIYEEASKNMYYDGMAFSKEKKSAIIFQSQENAAKVGKSVVQFYAVPLKVVME